MVRSRSLVFGHFFERSTLCAHEFLESVETCITLPIQALTQNIKETDNEYPENIREITKFV